MVLRTVHTLNLMPSKYKTRTTYDPAVSFLGIYLKNMKTLTQEKNYVPLCAVEHYLQ